MAFWAEDTARLCPVVTDVPKFVDNNRVLPRLEPSDGSNNRHWCRGTAPENAKLAQDVRGGGYRLATRDKVE